MQAINATKCHKSNKCHKNATYAIIVINAIKKCKCNEINVRAMKNANAMKL